MPSENEPRPARPIRPREEANFAAVAEKVARGIGAAVAVGAFFIALAIYERPGPPRFQAFAVGDEIVRIDTREGTIIACQSGLCVNVHHRGQDLARALPRNDAVANPAPAAGRPTPIDR
jgi:hypothetical protein